MQLTFLRSSIASLMVASVLCIASAANAKTVIDEKITYYDVSPTSLESLADSLIEATPIRLSGNTFFGQTRYSIEWTYDHEIRNKFCRVAKVKVIAQIKTTLPRLKSADSDILAAWDSWYPALEGHLDQHKQHAIETAEELDKKIKKLRRQKDCQILFENASALANEMISESLDRDVAYDEDTRFGYTEGAWSLFDDAN